MPQQLALPGHVATFRARGVPPPAATLANPLATPLAAVVSLGGCTASFVSPEGLIVTNHHCVQTALQLNSTKDADLVEHGFLAATKADEPTAGPAQGVLKGLAGSDLLQRKSALDARVTAWAAAPGRESYAAAIAKLAALNTEAQAHARVDSERNGAFYGSQLLASAFAITRWSVERAKPDESRRPGFQDRDLPRALGGTKQLAKQYDPTLDRAQFCASRTAP